PIPIKYLGLSLGIIGVVYSNTSFITSFDSPTDRPPIAYPGKSRDIISRALCFLKFSYSPPWIIPNKPCSSGLLCEFKLLSAHLLVLSTDAFIYSYEAGYGGHSYKTIIISGLKSFCIYITF